MKTKMKEHFNRVVAGILISTMVVTSLMTGTPAMEASAAAKPRFNDIASHWGEGAIKHAADMGMVNGDDKGNYNPNTNMTRAEFISIINNIMKSTATADLSEFSDVKTSKWYYKNLQKAYFMGTIWGKRTGILAPEDPITREDAFVGMARAMELSTDSTVSLSKFTDYNQISENGMKPLAALAAAGYINGFAIGGKSKTPTYEIRPNSYLTRAEFAAIVTNMFTEIYVNNKDYAGTIIPKCMVINEANATLNGMTINGDLVIGDGVGNSGVTIEGTTIKGRLVVRAGGPNSVHLVNTKVLGGIYVNSPSVDVRLVTEEGAEPGVVTAKTSTILDGIGFTSLQVPNTAVQGSTFNIWNADMDSVDIDSAKAVLNITGDSNVTNVRFGENSNQSAMTIAKNCAVEFVGVNAGGVEITGAGDVGELQINASGLSSSIDPTTYKIANNLTARVAGETVAGELFIGNNQNKVVRYKDDYRYDISASVEDTTSGAGLNVVTIGTETSNTAYVTAKGGVKVPLIEGKEMAPRSGYWVEMRIPRPPGSGASTATVVHRFDGEPKQYVYNVNSSGYLYLNVPVTRDSSDPKGNISQRVYIQWGSSTNYAEVLDIRASNLAIEDLNLQPSREAALIEQYTQGVFVGCDGEIYNGSEAIKRLLRTDNPLGLDLRAFRTYSLIDQTNIAVKMALVKDTLTTKAKIQKQLLLESSRKTALGAVNGAISAEELRIVMEDELYAAELGIDVSSSSKYMSLSELGKVIIARTILSGKKADFPDTKTFVAAFNKALETTIKSESTLLNSINACQNVADFQKIIENKTNYSILNLPLGIEPYLSFSAPKKVDIMTKAFDLAPYTSLDDVRTTILNLIGVGGSDFEEPIVVNSVYVPNNAITVASGVDTQLEAYVRYGAKEITAQDGADPINTKWTVDKPALAEVDEYGLLTPYAEGSVKVTITSREDVKKLATITVKIVKSVKSTSITLDEKIAEVEVGSRLGLIATVLPLGTTDKVTWSSEDPSVAKVDSIGRIVGISGGFTNIIARTTSGQQASCQIAVLPNGPDIILNLNKSQLEMGVSGTYELVAFVAPISQANRNVTWKSDNTNIATVKAGTKGTGTVTGVNIGNTTIIVTSQADTTLWRTCSVVVDDRLRVELDKKEITMFTNGIQRLTAKVVYPVGYEKDVTNRVAWNLETSASNIATLAEDPNDPNSVIISAIKPGTATLTVTSVDDSTAVTSVPIVISTTKLSVSLASKTFAMINDYMTTITLDPIFKIVPTNQKMRWTVNPVGFITIDNETNLMRPVENLVMSGKKDITITGVPEADMSQKVEAKVTLSDIPVTKFESTLSSRLEIYEGNTVTIPYFIGPEEASNKRVIWDTDMPNNVELTQGVYPYSDDSQKAKVKGTHATTKTTITPAAIASDGAIIKATETAIIDAPATLIGRTLTGLKVEIKVMVLPKLGEGQVKNVNIMMDNWVFIQGSFPTLAYGFNYEKNTTTGKWEKIKGAEDPANTRVTWTTDNSSVATVEAGVLRTLSPGVAQITCTSEDGSKSDTKTIVVAPIGVASISMGLPQEHYGKVMTMDGGSGKIKTLLPTITPTNATDKNVWYLTEAINPDRTATGGISPVVIDSAGKATAVKPGLAKVTITIPSDRPQPMYKNTTPDDPAVMLSNSQLTVSDGAFYGPNIEYKGAGNNTKEALNSTATIPLVVANKVHSEEFYIWVKPIPISTLTLLTDDTTKKNSGSIMVATNPNAATGTNVEIQKIRATFNSETAGVSPNITEGGIKWRILDKVDGKEITDVAKIQNISFAKDNYGYVSGVTAELVGLDVGVATIELSATSEEGKAPDSLSSGQPSPIEPSKTAKAIFTLTVKPIPATSYKINPPAPATANGEYYVGRTYDLAPGIVITPTYASIANSTTAYKEIGKRVSWGSTDKTVATINDLGQITFLAPGQTVVGTVLQSIDPQGENGKVVSYSFTLRCVPEPAIPSPPAFRSMILPSATVTVVTIDDPSAINTAFANVPDSIEDTGLLMAVSNTVAASETHDQEGGIAPTSDNLAKATPVKAISKRDEKKTTAITGVYTRTTANVIVGEITQLMPAVTPALADLSEITWSSADSKIATVDQNGIVTGITAGKSVRITARAANGKTAITTVSVKAKPAVGVNEIALSKEDLSLGVGSTSTLTVKYDPSGATVKGASWYSSDDTIASVDQYGKITARGVGTAVISVVTDDGSKTDSCKVTVVLKATGIAMVTKTMTIKVGETSTLGYTILPEGATSTVRWKTSSSSVVTVDQTGKIKGVRKGSAQVTVTTAEGKSSICNITVIN